MTSTADTQTAARWFTVETRVTPDSPWMIQHQSRTTRTAAANFTSIADNTEAGSGVEIRMAGYADHQYRTPNTNPLEVHAVRIA